MEIASSPRGAGSPYLRIHAIHVYVRDQERSLRFYVDQLGFDLAFDVQLEGGRRWVGVSPPDGTAVLILVAPEPGSKASELIGRPTNVVFVSEDVKTTYRDWRKRGVEFQYTPRLRRVKYELQGPGESQPPEPIWGGVITRFKDLDENSFTLVGFDELTREVEAQRRAIAEKREAERRAAQELEIATQVQARLFPQKAPSCKTLDYAGICLQARQVGGDYYDFLDLGQERIGLVVGDIAGKGIAAALLMANLQANLRSQCAIAWDQPQRFLRSVNQLFFENTSDSAYATLFFAEYDDRTRQLRYGNCGHLPGLILRNDGALERLGSTATVVGLFRELSCPIGEHQLVPGDILAVYTDGITESFNRAGEEYGEDRLVESLCRNRGLACGDLLKAVLKSVLEFSPQEQHDDITLIIARCKE